MTFQPDQTVVYKHTDQSDLALHVFRPDGDRPSQRRPGILFFFGGGWKTGSPGQFYPHCRLCASWGMVGISAQYRIARDHGTTPWESLVDARSAIRYVKTHGDELHIDPDRLICGGGSAGGHIAAAAGGCERINDPRDDLGVSPIASALVLFNPVVDNGPGGYGHERVEAYWRDFSPMHNIPANHPPTIIFMGTEDQHISPATMQRYCDAIEASGGPCELHLYDGQQHGFFNWREGSNVYYDRTVSEMKRFLAGLGYI